MTCIARVGWFAFAAAALPVAVAADTVRVNNPAGSVFVRVANVKELRVGQSGPKGQVRRGDTEITKQMGGELTLINCRSTDSKPIRLVVDLPYGTDLEVQTRTGTIVLSGMVGRADLSTESGDIRLTVPWAATRFSVDSSRAPQQYVVPRGFAFTAGARRSRVDRETWQMQDSLDPSQVTYSRVHVRAESPGKIILANAPIPSDFPVKLPWQAPAILQDLLGIPGTPDEPAAAEHAAPHPPEPPPGSSGPETGEVRFTADVRLVNLMVSATDRSGGAVEGLGKDQFQIFEDGKPQEVSSIRSEEVPFNLALLLDWSGSTEQDRQAMIEAAESFVTIARPQDRVAVYAMVGNLFRVISPLTNDRKHLRRALRTIPDLPGGSPLYDSMVFAYTHELRRHSGERNALLVLSDGLDNQIRGPSNGAGKASRSMGGLPSVVPFKQLSLAATGMETLIYPIFLDTLRSGARVPEEWSKVALRRLEELAERTGGLLFRASSIRDLDPVYPRVANELRSVYHLSYYPADQNFDDSWRKIEVKARRPRTTIRTRGGYFAR